MRGIAAFSAGGEVEDDVIGPSLHTVGLWDIELTSAIVYMGFPQVIKPN